MKKAVMLQLMLIIIVALGAVRYKADIYAAADKQKVDIVFTHDIHSYLEGYTDVVNGEHVSVGGMSRLATLLSELRRDNPNLLVLDGGDIAMGTLYQTLYTTRAPELRLLGELGFDATTFGNHDFDFSDDKLADMFEAASSSGDRLPAFCVSNIDWEYDNESTRNIYEQASKCNLCEYTTVEKNGVKIAVMGIFGKSAMEDSPTLQLKVDDQIESARQTVAKIKANEDVDMIVCISHSGTSTVYEKSEDELLADNVPDIDVIVSAHTHTRLEEPIIRGNTYIVSCGCYGRDTGYCNLSRQDDGRWSMDNYELITMSDDIASDRNIEKILDDYDKDIDAQYLSEFGLSKNKIIAYSPYNFEKVEDMYSISGEHCLGNILSDAYRFAARETGADADIAVVPAGTVRGTIHKGDIDISDAFECYSLGIGFDDQVGFPLVQFYLTGKELKLVTEIDATLSELMNEIRLYASGISYTRGSKRVFLNKAYDIGYNPNIMDDTPAEIEDDRLYAIVTDLYTARMLGSVTKVSRGLLRCVPKYASGEVLEYNGNDYAWENVVLYHSDGTELKAWIAIVEYLESFEANDKGISVIPEYYNTVHNRKVMDESLSFSQPNKYFWLIVLTVIISFSLLLMIIHLLTRLWINRTNTKKE